MSNFTTKGPSEQRVPVGPASFHPTLAIHLPVRERCRRETHREEEKNQGPPVELQPTKVDRKRKARAESPIASPEKILEDDLQSVNSRTASPRSQLNANTPERCQLPKAKRPRNSYGIKILEVRDVDVFSEPFPTLAMVTIGGTAGVKEDRAMNKTRIENLLTQFDDSF